MGRKKLTMSWAKMAEWAKMRAMPSKILNVPLYNPRTGSLFHTSPIPSRTRRMPAHWHCTLRARSGLFMWCLRAPSHCSGTPLQIGLPLPARNTPPSPPPAPIPPAHPCSSSRVSLNAPPWGTLPWHTFCPQSAAPPCWAPYELELDRHTLQFQH